MQPPCFQCESALELLNTHINLGYDPLLQVMLRLLSTAAFVRIQAYNTHTLTHTNAGTSKHSCAAVGEILKEKHKPQKKKKNI